MTNSDDRQHPYKNLAECQYWGSAVASKQHSMVNPAVNQRFKISPTDRVMTLGSCFAQHLSRLLRTVGFNYYVTESAPSGDMQSAKERNYGVFSARYGNIYSARQALQLLGRAFSILPSPNETWGYGERFVDPFRPSVEPGGFDSPDSLLSDRERHLRCTREAFESADILIFTLGMTEAWLSAESGYVYPLAPGVYGGSYNADKHRFVNLTFDETRLDLMAFCDQLRSFNPRIRIILTVSPVHYNATYENVHILNASIYSKSLLRVVSEEIKRNFDFVDYFPGYEIIAGPHHMGRYLDDDLRHVNNLGLFHVMRSFKEAFLGFEHTQLKCRDNEILSQIQFGTGVICDEDKLISF